MNIHRYMLKNKNSRPIQAFTLIELLIVISIIGILASIILVSLNSGRDKSKDAAIMSSVGTIMKSAQVNSTDNSGNYNFYNVGWVGTASDCSTKFSVSTPDYSQVVAACQDVIKNIGSSGIGGTPANKFYLGTRNNSTNPKLSMMVILPGLQTIYCIGSNDGASKTTPNVGWDNWARSGCIDDPNGNGS